MRVVLLGACAAMARPILPLVGAEPGVEEVVLADLAWDRVRGLARDLGARYRAVQVDARDRDSLVQVVRGASVAMGFIGPFYRFEAPIASACIEARVHYVSIADDFDAFLAVSALHDAAKAAGVTVISGLGNSPGLTNLLAKRGYFSMERPERIHIAWTGGSEEEVGPANVLHVMHIFQGETLQWMEGREVRVPCGSGAKEVAFPPPSGGRRSSTPAMPSRSPCPGTFRA